MANPDKVRGSKEVEEVSTQIQRWALKVSIHCEGCKRKVHKIINNIEGVERVDIDLKQHKVWVHGNVDPRTVIWKLEKAGKHAELWPQKQKPVNKESMRPGKDKNRDKQSSSRDEDGDGKVEKKLGVKGEAKDEAGDGEGRNAEDARNKCGKGILDGKASGGGEGEMIQKPTVVESRADEAEKRAATVPGNIHVSADANGEKIGDGNGGNRKNKDQNGKKEMCQHEEVHPGEKDAAAESAVPGGPDPNNGRTNQGPPRHHRVQRPKHNIQSQGPDNGPPPEELPVRNYGYYDDYPPPRPCSHSPPVYAVNYHAARPSSNYGASHYYAPQPPENSYQAHWQPRQEEHHPCYDPYYQRPAESFRLFSDENPNACSLM